MIVSPWIVPLNQARRARVRLFCFHYAGASASLFRPWCERLPTDVELLGIELPGHSTRFVEPLMRAAGPIVAELRHVMSRCVDKPYFFFGHSMGALLAYELASVLQEDGVRSPLHVIVSARRAPQITRPGPRHSELCDREFIEKLKSADGAITDVFENAELVRLLLPIWRADFSLSEKHIHAQRRALSCGLTAFGGRADEWVSEADISAWRECTQGPFSYRMFDSGHMFLHSHETQLLGALREILIQTLGEAA